MRPVTIVGMAAIAALSAGVVPEARAGEELDPGRWATFAYERPLPSYRLRLGLEEVAAVVIALGAYAIVDPPDSVPGMNPPYMPWDKLLFRPGTWTFDADDFGTNMRGHVTSGTAYYLIARGNRVSIPEAFGWTLASSLAWEILEWKEPASLNDMVMTSVGGFAVGEAFNQLSSFFDRLGPGFGPQLLSFLFNPVRETHDWIDGAVPDRDPRIRGWHDIVLHLGGGALYQSASNTTYAVCDLSAATRLVRVPGYGEPGRSRFAWMDGNASSVDLSVALAGSTVVDFAFATRTSIAGVYWREIDGEPGDRQGWDVLLGLTVGYEYRTHRWDLETGIPDSLALVRAPGVGMQFRWMSGPWTAVVGLDLALTFGGVQPFALQEPALLPPGVSLPSVLLSHGYYFALGVQGAPALELRLGQASLGGSLQVDLLGGLKDPDTVVMPGDPVHLQDQRWLGAAWLRWRRPGTPTLEGSLTAAWGSRSGSANGFRNSATERSLVGNIGLVF